MVKTLITVIISYLAGSISPAIMLGRIKGIDIKKEGSGNAGTTNVLRVMGGKAAAITLAVDILKGFLPALIFTLVFGEPVYGYFACAAAFMGHVFPLFFHFKGGKGVAVAFGGILGVSPKLALLCLLTVAVFTLVSKRMSVGSVTGAAGAVIYSFIMMRDFCPFVTVMAIIIIIMHRGNISRLIRHSEPPLSFLDRKKEGKE